MVAIFNFICLYQEIKYQKLFENNNTGRLFSLGSPVFSTSKTDCHDITEQLFKVALNTITLKPQNLSSLALAFVFRIDRCLV
jgi:hypothetical protein